jgi:two-component system, chemotaxis family, sensor kinase CheA
MAIDPEMAEIVKVFFEESSEGLGVMESRLLNLDAGADRETIDTIFRAAHSIKGGAGTFGFMEISRFTHAVETLLDEMRNGTRAVTADAVQVLLQAVDVTREMMDLAQADQPIVSAGAEALTAKLAEILATQVPGAAEQGGPAAPAGAHQAPAIPTMPAAATSPEVAPRAAEEIMHWRIAFKPHVSLFKTCNDPVRLFDQLQALGKLEVAAHIERLPPFGQMDPTECYLDWTLDLHGPATQPQLAEVFDWVDANSSISYELAGSSAPARLIEPIAAAAPAAPSGAIAPTPPAVPPGPVAAAAPKAPPAAAAPASKQSAESGSIRVATEKVDALINLVGELVITQSMLGRFSDDFDPRDVESLRRGLAQLARNTRELQESVLKIRMLPISFSFNRFPRLVHELSRKLGKKVELRLNGEGTELDKIVLEKIGDPLVHLVRNSLDHGLETPEVRRSAGKDETGILELNAFHEGGSIIIEVKDDGAGLNKSRILAKARERGLIAQDAALTDEQIHNLIFLPGFSTAEAVSDVSGRGVGMDVVRRNISDLGGHVQISSAPDQGSTIRIRLPLTLAILEGQMLRVGKETYVISLISIIETVQPSREHIYTVAGQTELFKHRHEYLPIIRLHRMFDIEPDSLDVENGLLIVAESDGRHVAILVDELLAQQQVVIKSLDANFKQVPGLAGATIHGDGTVALILDVPSLIVKFLESADGGVELAA